MSNKGRILVILGMKILREKNGNVLPREELFAAIKTRAIREIDEGKISEIPKEDWIDWFNKQNHKGQYLWENAIFAQRSFQFKDYIEVNKGNKTWILTSKGKSYLVNLALMEDSEMEDSETDTAESRVKNTGADLVQITVELLQKMGYKYVDPCDGPGDGGVDVIAYKDELGAESSRIKVQAKQFMKGQKVGDDVLRKLASAVYGGEIGVCITTSSFTKNAETYARHCEKHLRLIDKSELAELCVKYSVAFKYLEEE